MKLGRFNGADIRIHWTFWILIAFYIIPPMLQGNLLGGIVTVVFVAAVFACVLLHEMGHSAAAARFGIRTVDITLLPIGGVARLDRPLIEPKQEFWVAVAGPAVNLVIFAGLMILRVMFGTAQYLVPLAGAPLGIIDLLAGANLFLLLFNMLPIFPMDGGRVLRSLLSSKLGHLRATEIAAKVGRWAALGLAIYGLLYNPMLILLAAFVFFAGTAEMISARVQHAQRSFAGSSSSGPFSGAHSGGSWHSVHVWNGGRWHHSTSDGFPSSPYGGVANQSATEADFDGEVIDAVNVKRLPQ